MNVTYFFPRPLDVCLYCINWRRPRATDVDLAAGVKHVKDLERRRKRDVRTVGGGR